MHSTLSDFAESLAFSILVIMMVRICFKLGYKNQASPSLETDLFLLMVNFALIILPKSLYLTFVELAFLQPITEGFGWMFYTVVITTLMWSIAFALMQWMETYPPEDNIPEKIQPGT